MHVYIYIYIYVVFKRKNIDFNIFRPKASLVKLNFLTCYISLLSYIYIYIYIYIYKFIKNAIVRLPHPWSGDSQGQETFLAPPADKQTRNHDTAPSLPINTK